MTIRLHNSKTRKKEEFTPLNPENVRMYVCGPTVYDRAHIGNARPVVVFDTLFRLLRHVYGAAHVTYVRNFTDVDDKINAKAAETGRPIRDITDETIAWYHADMDALGALRPSHEPRATEYIGPMVAMIQTLIDGGHAYAKEGHVLFRVRSYKNYGALSGRSVDDMIAGARVEVAPFKEDPMDFVLWKPSDALTPGWDSPWGYGRPGWHIECSAMSYELLGASFDIHGGGLDLQFPHHENEIAQSCCAHPEAGFAQVWMHNEMLQVEGKKMSKSLGNFFTVRDLLDQGYPGEVIRFVMLSTHYRKPMDWTAAKAKQAELTLRKWRTMCFTSRPNKTAENDFLSTVADDLNTHQAITMLHGYARAGNAGALLACARVLGLLEDSAGDWFKFGDVVLGDARINEVNQVRVKARTLGLYSISDQLRDSLNSIGVAVFDNKLGSAAYFEPEILERFLLSKAHSSWRDGDTELSEKYVLLAKEGGVRVNFDADGPTASEGVDEDLAAAFFERNIDGILTTAKLLENKMSSSA